MNIIGWAREAILLTTGTTVLEVPKRLLTIGATVLEKPERQLLTTGATVLEVP